MRKWILAFLFLTLLGVAAVAAWRYLLPKRHVSDIYRRYEHADGIAASYIHNSPMLQMLIDRGENLVFSKLIPKSNPSASAGNDVLAYSYTTRSVSIFHIANDGEKHAVLYHNLKKSIDQDN